MAKATYRGPGDLVELDGIVIERGKSRELTNEQIVRLRASDPHAAVDVTETSAESPIELAKIRDRQDREREDAVAKSEKDASDAETERIRLERASADRSTKAARERDTANAKAARERDELRAGVAKKGAA